MLVCLLVFHLFLELAHGQYGCGQPYPFPQPSPILPPSPCTYQTTPMTPIIQPVPTCKGCPSQWQLPPLLPVPRIYPETPQGEYLTRPSDQFYVKDTKIIRHELDENATKSEQNDDPYSQPNTTFHLSPIVPETASYKHPNYYYSYNNYMQPQSNFGYGCGPQPVPVTLPPLPTLPPIQMPPPPPLIPLNNCCGRCTTCPLPSGYYGPRMRASRLFRREQEFAPRCTNHKLSYIMEQNRHLSIEEAKVTVQRLAESKLQDGYYHVFCSTRNLEYVTRTESYCTAEMLDGICYAFRTQAFT